MRRYHLIELEDQTWMPSIIRNGVTDYLRAAIRTGNTYGPVAAALAKVLNSTGQRHVIDLCAGGGGPWDTLLPALREEGWDGNVILTDRFPNLEVAGELNREISYHTRPVNALDVPGHLRGFRTLFTAFHHFPPAAAKALLADAAARQVPIALFEVTRRSPAYLLGMLFSPLAVMALTPFIRPFRWSRLIFTYLLPLIPFVVTWDGVVSCLRSYTAAELGDMTAGISGSYRWEIGEVKGNGPLSVSYLFGIPANTGAHTESEQQTAHA
ncbi:MAG: hypothetical protein HYX27_02585 [Acidobacteria bacterium]|nr:hypothetical protein [Acidobacteriota bacterium]